MINDKIHTSQVKSRKIKHFKSLALIKRQIDELYHILNSSRGALVHIANTFILKRFNKGISFQVSHTHLAHDSGYKSRTTGFKWAHRLRNISFMTMTRKRVATQEGTTRDEPCMYELNTYLFTPYALNKLGSLLPALKKFFAFSYLLSQKVEQQSCTLLKKYIKGWSRRYDFFVRQRSFIESYICKKEVPPPPSYPEDTLEGALEHLEWLINEVVLNPDRKKYLC